MAAEEILPGRANARGRSLNITLWVVQVLLALLFALAAAPKLFGQQDTVDMFAEIGAGQWLRYLTGALELAGAIGLLIPRLAGLAALGLAGVMLGAVVIEVFVLSEPAAAIFPAALVVVFGLIAWGRWPETRALLDRLKR